MQYDKNYIAWIRDKVGHDPIILAASVALIPGEGGKFLFTKQANGDWRLPGGMFEVGETASEVLMREVHEETGLVAKIERFQGVYTNHPFMTYPNGDVAQVLLFVFVCSVNGEIIPDGNEVIACEYRELKSVSDIIPDVYEDFVAGAEGVAR